MRFLVALGLLFSFPLLSFAQDPTVTQNAPLKNIDDTIHISATVTAAPGTQVITVWGCVRKKTGGVWGTWSADAYLGAINPPFQGNTAIKFATGDEIETGIIVYVNVGGSVTARGIFDVKSLTVP